MTVAPFIMQQIWIPRQSTVALPAAVGAGTPPNAVALFPGFIPSSAHAENWRSSEHFPSTLWLPPHGDRLLLGVLAKTAADQLVFGATFHWGRHLSLGEAIHGALSRPTCYLWAGELRIVNPRDEAALGTIVEVNETAGGLHKEHALSLRHLLKDQRKRLPIPIATGTQFVLFNPASEHLMASINGLGNVRHRVDNFLNPLIHFPTLMEEHRGNPAIIAELEYSVKLILAENDAAALLDFITANILTVYPEQRPAVAELTSMHNRFRAAVQLSQGGSIDNRAARGAAALSEAERTRLYALVSDLAVLFYEALRKPTSYELFVLNSDVHP